MKITIECRCGNKVVVPNPAKTYTQFRDYLFQKGFRVDIIEGKKIRIECEKCRHWNDLDIG